VSKALTGRGTRGREQARPIAMLPGVAAVVGLEDVQCAGHLLGGRLVPALGRSPVSTARTVRVAIFDSGIDYTHGDLGDQYCEAYQEAYGTSIGDQRNSRAIACSQTRRLSAGTTLG